MHKHVCVKVNAWVDEGVAPLVEALNDIEGLVTFESCQELFPGEASILFTYGASRRWGGLAKLCAMLAKTIRERNPDSGCTVAMEWRGSNDQPWGRLTIAPQQAEELANTIRTTFH